MAWASKASCNVIFHLFYLTNSYYLRNRSEKGTQTKGVIKKMLKMYFEKRELKKENKRTVFTCSSFIICNIQ
jgi:hypothetical protein